MRKISLIVNPFAGGGRAGRALADVERALTGHDLQHHTEQTTSLEHAGDLARGAAAAGEVAVAFGGDGLVGAVAGALRYSDATLGVLPGGRGNDLARVLGIPLEPVAACEVLASGTVTKLDLGEAEARTFVGIASCGFDSDANRIANQSRLIRGNFVYTYAAVRALTRWQPATFWVKLDGSEALTVYGYSVAAANSKAFGGGMLLAPEASLEDGLLDVVMITHVPRLRFLRLLPTAFTGRHVLQPNVHVRRAAELEISSDRPFTLYADGDPIAELPTTVRALSAAVRVLVPA